MRARECRNCDKMFQPLEEYQQFCDDECRDDYWAIEWALGQDEALGDIDYWGEGEDEG